MDDLTSEEVKSLLQSERKRILKFFESISKPEHVDGQVVRTIDITQITKLLISKKIVPHLIPKRALARLFRNVQQLDLFASDARNEFLTDDQFVLFVGAVGLLAFKLQDDIERKFPSHELKIKQIVHMLV